MDKLFTLFHWYGFLIGIGVVMGVSLCERKALREKIPEHLFWQVVFLSVLGGVVGARLYHVATDFYLYTTHWTEVWQVWQGGLSIIGAFIGALGISVAFLFFTKQSRYIPRFLDIVPFGVPFAQAIGRLGNFVNQELYGLPSNLPWAISIDPEHRLPGFQMFEKYHPLFAYESFLLLWFGLALWQVSRWKKLPVGSGRIFLWYVLYYSCIRFWLDFLRIDKAMSGVGPLGVNQVVLVIIFMMTLVLLLGKKSLKHLGMLTLCIGLSLSVTGCQVASLSRSLPHASEKKSVSSLPDRQVASFQLKDRKLRFEVVNSPASMTQGLSDRKEIGSEGMLFVFGETKVPQFWMKDMQFDLDLVWLSDLKVVEVTHQVPRPRPGQQLKDLPRYSPGSPVNMVLELPSGTAKQWGLQAGDSFTLLD